MSENHLFDVQYTGKISSNLTKKQVAINLFQIAKLKTDAIKKVLLSDGCVLKRNVTKESAQKITDILNKCGLNCIIVATQDKNKEENDDIKLLRSLDFDKPNPDYNNVENNKISKKNTLNINKELQNNLSVARDKVLSNHYFPDILVFIIVATTVYLSLTISDEIFFYLAPKLYQNGLLIGTVEFFTFAITTAIITAIAQYVIDDVLKAKYKKIPHIIPVIIVPIIYKFQDILLVISYISEFNVSGKEKFTVVWNTFFTCCIIFVCCGVIHQTLLGKKNDEPKKDSDAD